MDRFRPEELRVARLARGLNLREAAALTGVTKESLSALERGQRFPHAHTLRKIADAYGLPIEHFLYTREEAPASPKAQAPSPPPETGEERRQSEAMRQLVEELREHLVEDLEQAPLELLSKLHETLPEGIAKDAAERARARVSARTGIWGQWEEVPLSAKQREEREAERREDDRGESAAEVG